MRRSFISITTAKRLASTYNKRKKIKEQNKLIRSQGYEGKEREPCYELSNVDFNLNSRIAHIEFLQLQEYRTIQKYVTQNYTKYPIYSEWKTKKKIIKKTIKLTNLTLENLNINDDSLIRAFASEIIIKLDNEDIFPSWFIKKMLKEELNSNINRLTSELNSFGKIQENKINYQTSLIILINKEIYNLNVDLSKLEKNKKEYVYKIDKICKSRPNLFKAIFTFGIYCYLISKKRKLKLESHCDIINNKITKTKQKINEKVSDREKHEDEKKKIELLTLKRRQEINNRINEARETYQTQLINIEPLNSSIGKDNKFIMLKKFSGLEYKKIVGVYIIHNIEKDKYYVGQSKDVMKRIKQNFVGTTPKNIIFAEDYYNSKIENRENLFEIKIITCETKDELDSLEKELIYEYDSFENGYNGTSGNI